MLLVLCYEKENESFTVYLSSFKLRSLQKSVSRFLWPFFSFKTNQWKFPITEKLTFIYKRTNTYIQQALSVNINEMSMSTDAFSIESIENIWL